MARALREVAGDTVADRIHWEPDARVERIVGSWPGRWDTSRRTAGAVGRRQLRRHHPGYIDDDLPR